MRYTYTKDDLEGRPEICIEDMCGSYSDGTPANYWADWDGEKVMFGGDWQGVPDMPTPNGIVTEERVRDWVEQHQSKEEQAVDTVNTQGISDGRARGSAHTGEPADQHLL